MTFQDKIVTFEKLSIFFEQFSVPGGRTESSLVWLEELNQKFFRPFELIIENSHIHNPWFTEDNLRFAIGKTGKLLKTENLVSWLTCYGTPFPKPCQKTVAVIMAGNIPLVGFHDMLCVLLSGHKLIVKLSAKDDQILKFIAEVLIFMNNYFAGKIYFEDGRLKDFDAVIATGSDNTSRYFEYYFGKYPNIIRKNRNSAAILDGSETRNELRLLADDIFRYFGLGCRSVSKVFLPEKYSFDDMLHAFNCYSFLINHNLWANNYDYQRAIHLIDKIEHLDTGFLLLREDSTLSSPIAVLNFQKVKTPETAIELIDHEKDKVQCVVGKPGLTVSTIPFGKAQEPELNEYADNIDTMDFLLKL